MKPKAGFFEINKMDKPLATLTKNKTEKTQLLKSGMKEITLPYRNLTEKNQDSKRIL